MSDVKKYILIDKENLEFEIEERDEYFSIKKKDQPEVRVYKHRIDALGTYGWATLQKNKAVNFMKKVKDLIKEAIKDGTGKAV